MAKLHSLRCRIVFMQKCTTALVSSQSKHLIPFSILLSVYRRVSFAVFRMSIINASFLSWENKYLPSWKISVQIYH